MHVTISGLISFFDGVKRILKKKICALLKLPRLSHAEPILILTFDHCVNSVIAIMLLKAY